MFVSESSVLCTRGPDIIAQASGFKNVHDVDKYDKDGTRLFQCRGTTAFNTRAIQVPERAASLNSGDTFILETPSKLYIWAGKGSTGDEREFAKAISKSVASREYELISEGSEPEAFWTALGGRTAYAAAKTEDAAIVREARLFQCTNAVGYFRVEEIFDYDQEDLIEDDVMILDTYAEVFVWIGKGANTEEKSKSLATALEYIKTDPSGRTVQDTVIVQLKQGFEPPNFTAHFIAWDPEKWSNGKTYEQLKAEAMASGNTAALETSVEAALSKLTTSVYPLSALIGQDIPEGVDPTKKEQYLSNEEFQQVFGISKAEFNGMPAWKTVGLKKKVNLY